jgi:nucleotide-binding universal stress UspA family protein
MTAWNQRILVPTDGTAFADRMLVRIRPLLDEESEVTLLHVYPRSVFGEATKAQDAIAKARKRLARLAKLVEKWGARAKVAVMVGDPAEEIAAFARSYRPSLVAMATHARAGVGRIVQGSVAETVLRATEFPVLLANATQKGRSSRIRRILVPLDGSGLASSALPTAKRVAKALIADLVLLQAVPVAGVAAPEEAVMTHAEAKGYLSNAAQGARGITTRTVVATGKAADSILRAIERERADLVVMSSHGHSGVARWILGSVAEKVVRSAPCPVLVTRGARGREAAPKTVRATARAK